MASAARARVVIVREKTHEKTREKTRADSRRRDGVRARERVRARAEWITGVGETTLAKRLRARVIELEPTCEVVHACYDAYEREARAETTRSGEEGAGTFDPAVWKESRERAAEDVRRAIKRANERCESSGDASTSGKSMTLVIVDDNMYYHGMRWKMFRDARDARACCATAHVLTREVETTRARNAGRERDEIVSDEVLDRMARAFEAPVVTSPGDAAAFPAFVVEADDVVDVDKVWTTILEHWGPPPAIPVTDAERDAEREIARAETANSALHARRARESRLAAAVTAVAADSNDSSRVARVAKRVNDARRDLLRDARAIDRTRDDVFEELALLERRFADAACV